MSGLILALQFFTRLPVHSNVDFSEKNLRTAFFFLPLIGFLFGGSIVLILYAYHEPAITALLAVLAYVLLGGSLHLDGLSDCADGLAANAEKEKTLAIMSDPHTGTFGVIAIVLDLLVRFVMYQFLSGMPLFLLLSPVFARVFVLYAIQYGKPAKQSGLGFLFFTSISKRCFPVYFLLSVSGIALLCFFKRISLPFLALPVINLIVVITIVQYAKKKLGGTTGDVNGAIVEVLDLLNLLLCYFLW